MKIINRVLTYYFIFALPLIVLTWVIWPASMRTETAIGSSFLEWMNAIIGYTFSLWILSALYIAISLIFSRKFREQLLKRITHMKERDEREEMIVGKTARNVFLFNLALLIFLLILNLIQINVAKLPPDQALQGKEHYLSLGLNFFPIEDGPKENFKTKAEDGDSIFSYSFPVTVSGILMFLIISNIGLFYLYTRRFDQS